MFSKNFERALWSGGNPEKFPWQRAAWLIGGRGKRILAKALLSQSRF